MLSPLAERACSIAPSPLVGEGWGEGGLFVELLLTLTFVLSHQGRGNWERARVRGNPVSLKGGGQAQGPAPTKTGSSPVVGDGRSLSLSLSKGSG